MTRYWKNFCTVICAAKKNKTLKNVLQIISLCWEYVCIGTGLLIGLCVTLVGVVGILTSKHPESGCCEFVLYGPIIIFLIIYYSIPKKV
jgi:hypothetical protein